MTRLTMPPARDFGWTLKETTSSHFAIVRRANGQFCVVLNHAPLRGVTAEMLRWWFLHFPKLRVRLVDTPGYLDTVVPAYHLWHPIDHHSADLKGSLGPGGVAKAGAMIHIREAMQYDRYGWKHPVDSALKIAYVGEDGWAMGRSIPIFGTVMMLRIHFRDGLDPDGAPAAHYHYEIVIGANSTTFFGKQINNKISRKFGPEFFEAWHRHNVVEVGVFENFLPALFSQRANIDALVYERVMDPKPTSAAAQSGCDRTLFEARRAAYATDAPAFETQRYASPTFI